MKILIAGGAGYIGSILSVKLLQKGYEVIIADNYSNVVEKYGKIAKIRSKVSDHLKQNLQAYEIDLSRNVEDIVEIFKENTDIDVVINLAASKYVEDGENHPAYMLQNNINIQNNLLAAMEYAHCNKLIFASSATVYNDSYDVPFKEADAHSITPDGVYGLSKWISEKTVEEYAYKNDDFSYAILRFFNVIGAYEDLGDSGVHNIVPIMFDKFNKNESLHIFGADYDTEDGTCERDYVDVNDIVEVIMRYVEKYERDYTVLDIVNIGHGKPVTVFQLVEKFNEIFATETHALNYTIDNRRLGDLASSYCDNSELRSSLGFIPRIPLEESLRSSYNYYNMN